MPKNVPDWDARKRLCTMPGCSKRHVARGYCGAHYRRYRRGEQLDLPLCKGRRLINEGSPCSVPQCGREAIRRLLCSAHYQRYLVHGETFPDKPIMVSKGSYIRKKDGYVVVPAYGHPNGNAAGSIMEHIKVMSEMIGRPLIPGENVHHRNGIRHDNRPENLELWVRRQPSGQRVEDLLQFAYEIIKRYEKSDSTDT